MSLRPRTLFVSRGLLAVVALGAASAARALPPPGNGSVIGWIEDAKGAPLKGVLVSLFGSGLGGSGLVTLSDNAGRFMLPALPAGSYTLRALGSGGATSQQITVLPNRDSIFTLSFAAAAKAASQEDALETGSAYDRELRWLLRHKRRSVLEERSVESASWAPEPAAADRLGGQPYLPELGGALELMTSPALFGAPSEARGLDLSTPSLGSLRLNGRLADSGSWSLGGLLADSQSTSWRMAAEFVMEPGGGHRLQAGAGYGSRVLQPGFSADSGRLDNRAVGAVFVQDRVELDERWALSGGARYSYVGFVADKGAVSPNAGVEYKAGKHTRVAAQFTMQTLAPGGDLLTLSTLQAAPALAIAVMSEDVRPERLLRQDLVVDRRMGRATSVTAFAFRESAADQLLNALGRPGGARTLRITNGRGLVVNGAGLRLASQLGDVVRGSVTYTFGRSRPAGYSGALEDRSAALGLPDGSFHDLVARVEAFVDWSGTRFVAYCRLNTQVPELEPRVGTSGFVSRRFDVQLNQDLPFLRSIMRSDWELLLAFRNMFYEAAEAGMLDEIAVVNPPKRVLGGLSVRF